MDTSQAQEAARVIARHRLNRIPLPNMSDGPKDVTQGYAVQLEAQRILRDSLGAVAGHKIGATNAAIQRKLGVGHPCAGTVYASTVWRTGVALPVTNFIRPGLECEIAFRFGRDLAPRTAPYERADLTSALDACMISMEIVDNRYEDFAHIHIPTLIADDTLDAGVILGEPHTDWRSLDMPNLTGIIRRDGSEISRGTASNVLGDPLNAMVWIANTYSQLGRTLKRGEFVSTGSIADLIWVKAGEHYEIEVEKLGTLEVKFV
jgi:2-keto-4-pentenoate hydratase